MRLTAQKISTLMQTAIPVDPDYRPRGKRQIGATTPMFGSEKVFLSHSLVIQQGIENGDLLQEMVVENRKAANPGLRAPFLVRRFIARPKGAGLSSQGEYSVYLPMQIKDSEYVIHDFTHLSTGVAFETGVSIGYHKPHFLFWNERQIAFDSKLVPECLSDIDMKILLKDETHRFQWFRTVIDDPGLSYPRIECPFEAWQACTFKPIEDISNYVFIAFPKSRIAIEDFLANHIKDRFDLPVVRWTHAREESRYSCALLYYLENCKCAFIDGGGDLSETKLDELRLDDSKAIQYADEMEKIFLLGVSAARNLKCAMTWRRKGVGKRPVAMWGKRPNQSYTLSDYESVLPKFVASMITLWSTL
jgi:hypothetical protein